ncbi:MAG TPA: hypothetical protein VN928_00675 [Myxococcales bacterium]|nr:hypothetical protein [Myxococcales bacterium]
MRLLLGLSALMLAIGFATLWFWRSAPAPAECESRDVGQSLSPDGRSQADVFEVRCGRTVATHVALRPSGSPLEARFDVFIVGGSEPVRAVWIGERELLVESSTGRVLAEETRWRDVGIRIRRGP